MEQEGGVGGAGEERREMSSETSGTPFLPKPNKTYGILAEIPGCQSRWKAG